MRTQTTHTHARSRAPSPGSAPVTVQGRGAQEKPVKEWYADVGESLLTMARSCKAARRGVDEAKQGARRAEQEKQEVEAQRVRMGEKVSRLEHEVGSGMRLPGGIREGLMRPLPAPSSSFRPLPPSPSCNGPRSATGIWRRTPRSGCRS